MSAKRRIASKSGFTLVEIIFAVAILSVSLIGISAIISMSGNQATRLEDEREISELTLSLKTCASSFGVPYLRSLSDGRKTEIWFWSGNASCQTWQTLTGAFDYAKSPKIELKTSLQDGAETVKRSYGAYLETFTDGIGQNSVKAAVTVTNGTVEKKLEFRTDSK